MLYRKKRKTCPAILTALAVLAGVLSPVSARAGEMYPDAYSSHGALTVADDGQVADVFGRPYQIKGMSVDTSALNADYLTQETFSTLKDELQINTVRIPVALDGPDGYCEGDDMTKAVIRSNVYTALNAAIYQDMYAILDWDLGEADDLIACKDQAHAFLEDIAQAYSGFANVIYEIGSGESTDMTWNDYVYYATDLVDCIRYYSPDALVIVGLPDEGKALPDQSMSLISRSNLLYGCTLDPMDAALLGELENSLQEKRLPLFVSAFSPANEEGEIAWQTDGEFFSLLNYYNTGWCFYRLSHADEDDALLADWYTGNSGWTADAYSPAGGWLKAVADGEIALPDYQPPERIPSPTDSVLTAGGGTWSFDNGVTVAVTESSRWSDGASWYSSYDIVITNNSASPLSGWRLRFSWDCSVGDKEYWSCQTAGDGSSRLVGPADYNSSIPAGSYATLGIVVSSENPPVLNSVSFE